MNTVALLLGLRPWTTRSPLAWLTSVFAAISVVSLEAQIVTVVGIGSLRSLVPVNVALVAILVLLGRRRPGPVMTGPGSGHADAGAPGHVPVLVGAGLALGVLALNLMLPLQAADPYHLDKLQRIEETGRLPRDPDADPKINILSSVYELVLADLRLVPFAGPWMVQAHGLIGLSLYLLAIGAARELLRAGPGWAWTGLLVVPVVFHQLVLLKNDLFVAVPALIALLWALVRARAATWHETLWSGWLAGLVVGIKLTSLPLVVVLVWMVARGERQARHLRALALGGLLGLAASGLPLIILQNLQLYGEIMPSSEIGSRYAGIVDMLVGIARFGISLVDLGVLTRLWWPGRGGWGGTFGLPLVWALAVLALHARQVPIARAALLTSGAYGLMFAAAFPDADLSQRLALAPGLLVLCVAAHIYAGTTRYRPQLGAALIVALAVSCVQLGRSAVLYVLRA